VLREHNVNQRINGGAWITVGEAQFNAGTQAFVIGNRGADGNVVADGVRVRWKAF
jgi:hypothetical protein